MGPKLIKKESKEGTINQKPDIKAVKDRNNEKNQKQKVAVAKMQIIEEEPNEKAS